MRIRLIHEFSFFVMAPRIDSNTHHILMYIRDHPEGVTRRDVADNFLDVPMPSISTILDMLKNFKLIYNNGVMGPRGSTWYPVLHEVEEPYPTIAAELVQELLTIHYDGHELHLARRLKEIFG